MLSLAYASPEVVNLYAKQQESAIVSSAQVRNDIAQLIAPV